MTQNLENLNLFSYVHKMNRRTDLLFEILFPMHYDVGMERFDLPELKKEQFYFYRLIVFFFKLFSRIEEIHLCSLFPIWKNFGCRGLENRETPRSSMGGV